MPEDEGQHIQKVYPAAGMLGGQRSYAFNPESHMTESSEYVSDVNRRAIFDAWAQYWNTSAPVLLEKSPPNLMKMRMLQELFTPERSRFVVSIRHPLACAHFYYTDLRYKPGFQADCAANFVEHWLTLYRTALEDLQIPDLAANVVVVQHEDVFGSTMEVAQGYIAELEMFLSLERQITLLPAGGSRSRSPLPSHHSRAARTLKTIAKAHQQQHQHQHQHQQQRWRRRVLGYRGEDRQHVEVNLNTTFDWIKDFRAIFDLNSDACQSLIGKFEEEVNSFGYSLRDPSFFADPPALHPFLLKTKALGFAS